MAEQEGVAVRKGREGSRWINERPTSEAVAEWFKEAVSVPEGLDVAKYVSGVTLIQASEEQKEVIGFRDTGAPIWQEIEHIVYVPYVKVETRVQFFHDLMEANPDWLGVVEPIPVPNPDPKLPPGFFKFVSDATAFICCTMKVTVFDRKSVKYEPFRNTQTGQLEFIRTGLAIIDAPPATKMVPTKRKYADTSSIMKAETGAMGRALGMAGMLIVPGSGVATAEDMREAQEIEQAPAASREEAPAGPEGARALEMRELSHEELTTRAVGLIQQLKETNEEAHASFMAWVKEKKYEGKVSQLPVPALKGLIKKAEKDLEAAAAAASTEQE